MSSSISDVDKQTESQGCESTVLPRTYQAPRTTLFLDVKNIQGGVNSIPESDSSNGPLS